MTKTCGECKYFSKYENKCCLLLGRGVTYADSDGCMNFVQKLPKAITNGDKIRQMSNKNLAIFLGDRVYCFTCPTKGIPCFDKPKDVCYQKWLDYLNAPAESEETE